MLFVTPFYGADRATGLDCGPICLFSFHVFSISLLFTLMVLPTQSGLYGQKFCQSWRIIIIIHLQGTGGVCQYHCFRLCLDSLLLSVSASSTNSPLPDMPEILMYPTPCLSKQCLHIEIPMLLHSRTVYFPTYTCMYRVKK
jgi:hypothetical protein